MRKIIKQAVFLLLLLMSLSNCRTHSSQKSGQVVPPEVIEGVLKSTTGEELQYFFNNAVHTMVIQYQRETITLAGQTTGSGIKYANGQYTYTQWQGNATLRRDGVTIFKAYKEPKKLD